MGWKSAEEKRWELMQQVLLAENRGEEPHAYSSGRTLFGIKSHVDEVIERVAAEDEERCRQVMAQAKAAKEAQETQEAQPAQSAPAQPSTPSTDET